ncbi:hypothetical protein PFISCL1PPCAC_6575, partial [Pristionchus fissidentatus]
YSIRNPLKKQRISTVVAGVITVAAALLAIVVTEIVAWRTSSSEVLFRYRKFTLPPLLVHIIAYFGYFQLGYVMEILVNQVTKYAVGRLRPHFYTVCKPIGYNCTEPGKFIYDFKCTGDEKEVKEARLSFYSGHSAVSMYTATFLAIYFYIRLRPFVPRIILSTLQTIVVAAALLIAYTRIQDFWHHPSDVAVGTAAGFLGGLFTCYAWADFRSIGAGYEPIHGEIENEDTSIEVKVETIMKEASTQDGYS